MSPQEFEEFFSSTAGELGVVHVFIADFNRDIRP
jgi:hypothetical protein